MTAHAANNAPEPGAQAIPTEDYLMAEADAAFEVVCEVSKLMKGNPSLRPNPYYTALLDTAYARFFARFGLLK